MTVDNQPIEGIFFRSFAASHIPEILEEIYLKEIYKPFLLGKKDAIIVDVGANIGLFSYYAKNYAREVFALEPDPHHIEELNTMLAYNKIDNVTVCPYALGGKTERLKLYQNSNTTANSFSLVENPNNFTEVDVLSFDEFMARNKLAYVDLLKLDPEGEEAKILASEGFAAYAKSVKVIVGEYHQWCNMEKDQFANLLRDLGYEFHWIPNMKASVYTAIRL